MNSGKGIALGLTALVALTAAAGPRVFAADTIKIGGIFDKSGPTSDTGRYAAQAVEDYFNYVNTNGGINGKQIEFISLDDAYNVAQGKAHYTALKAAGVIAILGWGTGTAQALAADVNNDKIPYLPASFAESLVNPVKPYNFSIASSYDDEFITLLKYANANPRQGRPVRVAFVYNNSPFGISPIPTAEKVAQEIGVLVVGKEIVELKAIEADEQMARLAEANPDYVIFQETGPASIAILKSAKKAGLTATMMATFYGGDENILKQVGELAGNYLVVSPFSRWYEDGVTGMEQIKQVSQARDPAMNEWPMYYIQGWVMARVIAEAIQKAGSDLTGEGVKNALEGIQNFSTNGLSDDVTFSPDNHKGTQRVKMFKADPASARFRAFTGWIR